MFDLAFVDPVIVELGPFSLRWYGLIFVSGVIAAVYMTARAARVRGLDPEFPADLALVLVPSGILGARLYEVFVLQWTYYKDHLDKILAIWEGGLAIHGGIIGSLLACFVYVRYYRKQPFWLWADMVAPGLILAQAIGRWGNFFNQEAFGSPAPDWVINLMPGWLRDGMTIDATVMHPTFLYESAWNIAGSVLLWNLVKRRPPAGTVFGVYFITYNVGRFLIESIREDSSFTAGGLRIAQVTSILMILAGVVLIWWANRRKGAPTT